MTFYIQQKISFASYTEGTTTSPLEKWKYSDGLVVREAYFGLDQQSEDVIFDCKGHDFQFISQLYGIVIWNGKSWVWFHPRYFW